MVQLPEPTSGAVTGCGIIVTGAASGIGRALAIGFARDGATVVGIDRDGDGLATLEPLGVLPIVGDVAAADTFTRGVDAMRERIGRLDVLINNAGVGLTRSVESLTSEQFARLHAVHVLGALHGIHAAVGPMRERGRGRIVNVISRAAEFCLPDHAAYSSAKAALWALSTTAAAELRDENILVNCLIPGMTNTGIWGRPRADLQEPEAVYPTALALAALPSGGPSGKVFWDGVEYPMFASTLGGDPPAAR